MVNACADPDFFLSRRGGGSKPNGEKTALIFYVCFGVYSPNFPGMRGGVQLFTRGSKC